MYLSKALTAGGVAAAVLLLAQSAGAAVVVDADNLTAALSFGGYSAFSSKDAVRERNSGLAQTWTSTITGELDSIELWAYSNASAFNLTLSIYQGGSDLAPGTTLLGSAVFASQASWQSTQQVIAFDLSALNIATVAGQSLTFALDVDDCTVVGCSNVFYNPVHATPDYAGGMAFILDPDPRSIGDDLNFRVLVESAVPEPTSWALMIAGFGLAGGSLRRRRTAALSL